VVTENALFVQGLSGHVRLFGHPVESIVTRISLKAAFNSDTPLGANVPRSNPLVTGRSQDSGSMMPSLLINHLWNVHPVVSAFEFGLEESGIIQGIDR